MTAATWRPDIAVQVAFNASPNTTTSVANWQDLSTGLFVGANQIKRGRQYELNQNLGSQPNISYLDPNEYLNPANTSSPYYPNVTIYRHTLMQAMWPNNGSGNLLNTGSQGVSYDTSFEATATGATPTWITGVAVGPTVSTTNPRTGSKDLSWVVSAVDATQGASWPVPCIPGRQYTASAYVRQTVSTTQALSVTDQNLVIDAFNRTVANGWGTADVGGAWTRSGGAAGDYAVASGSATHTHTATGSAHYTTAGSAADADVVALVTMPVVTTGAAIAMELVTRWADTSNYYTCGLNFNTDQTMTLRTRKAVAGVVTVLSSTTLPQTYAAGSQWWVRVVHAGTTLTVSAWPYGKSEADATSTHVDNEISLTAAGAVGARSIVSAGNTNTLPLAVTYAQFASSGSVAGSTTTTAGSYVRLSVTWTATQPTHTVQVVAPYSPAATTVYLDDLQHETGASASTYTSSGPVIYSVARIYTERWPASWVPDNQGFLGAANTIGVDAFAAFNKIALWTELRNAILSHEPTYYWVLNEGSGSTTFGEDSGNNGPSLVATDSKYGPAPTFSAGTATNIAGDISGTGLSVATSATTNIPATVAQTGMAGTAYLSGLDVLTQYTVVFTLAHTTLAAGAAYGVRLLNSAGQEGFSVTGNGTGNHLIFTATWPNGGVATAHTVTVTDTYASTNSATSHLFIATVVVSGGTGTLTVYADDGFASIGTASGAADSLYAIQQPQVGGYLNPATKDANPSIAGGVYAHLALWPRALDSGGDTSYLDIQSAYTGYPGETSGARVTRYLGYGWTGPTSIDTGASVMGVSNLTAGTSLLAACQAVTTTENGNFWVDSRGYTRFSGRDTQYYNTTSLYTFGENTAGGEYPYQDAPTFGFDPTLVYDIVTVANYLGPTVTVADTAAIAAYFPNAYSRTVDVLHANEVYDAANYLLNQYGAPRQRVESIVLDPIAYPSLWPVVLSLEINNRVTVKRRPKAANAGAGLTMSQDYFVESISHDNVNMDPAAGRWLVTLLLAPVDLYQVGILDDATYGILDSTMILAY